MNCESMPERDAMLDLATTLGVRTEWLEYGEEPMKSQFMTPPRTVAAIQQIAEQASTGYKATEQAATKVLEMLAKHGKLNKDAEARLVEAVQQSLAEAKTGKVISADFSGSRLKPGEILIPQYDVRGSMGHGQVPADYTDFMRNVTVSGPQLEKLGLDYTSPANLAIISGWGQSMAPTIQDKDPVIVDRGVTDFTGDGVYVITWDGMLYIKRLQKVDAESIELISDNPKHKDRVVSLDEVAIHARVLLVWNAQKL
ncbi:Phage repressor protein cI [Pseudomonas sp. SO81]|nr:Phage repressor protein cI [Pseudomonas sp. SO81]